MNTHVDLQVAPLPEALHALVTSVGFLPGVNPHVDLQVITPFEALHTLVTPVGLLPGVNSHVDLQVTALTEALHALATPVGLLTGVGTHVDGHLGIVGKNLATQDTGPALAAAPTPSQLLTVDELLAGVQALGHTVVHGQRAEGLQIRHGEEGLMTVHHQLPPPFSVDTQDPQLPVVTGHVGRARAVRMQTIRGGAVLCAAVSNVIAVFCRGKQRE